MVRRYFTDELGWIDKRTQLEAGMKTFYQKTGVQPYLYITDNIDGSQSPSEADVRDFAFSLYDRLFSDEAHLLLIFFEPSPSQYSTWYVTGTQAKAVLDAEAMDILLDYIDRYYHYDISDEEFFSRAFADAAKRMTVPDLPGSGADCPGNCGHLLIGFLVAEGQEQKNREPPRQSNLNTPLDTFGEDSVEDLAEIPG